MQPSLYALIDSNNFYVSCERAFVPKLLQCPVIVLSNNDGCVISRSNEAKKLGVPMGAPYFKIKTFCQQHKMTIFSSNYALYGDMSARVVAIIKSFEPKVEIYSIDEVFVELQGVAYLDLKQYLSNLQQTILQQVGIPVSIGVGRTKTLAKIASFQAKKKLVTPVCILGRCIDVNQALASTPVREIWGVGRRWAEHLKDFKIETALGLSLMDANVIRRQYNSVLADTVRELQGRPCLKLESLASPKKNIMSSKSFGQLLKTYQAIAEALSHYTVRTAEKLRGEGQLATEVTVILETNRFTTKDEHRHSISLALPYATNDTGLILQTAKLGLRQLYQAGKSYQKTGVLLGGFIPAHSAQQFDLFHPATEQKQQHKKSISKVSHTLDAINQRFGKDTMFIASQHTHPLEAWSMRAEFKSPHYTTCWSDILSVKA